MPLVINTNVASINAQRFLSQNTSALNKNLERLSSGYRINRAADDAAGLQISETLRAQIRGVSQAINNAEDGFNMLSIAEGTLSVVQENLQRIRELTVQAANDTNGTAQRLAIKQEIDARLDDITRMTRATLFNGVSLLAGNFVSFRLQVGANEVQSLDTIDVSIALGSATAATLAGVSNASFVSSLSVTTNHNARAFLVMVDRALDAVGSRRATIGSLQNRLESAISNLNISRENFSAAESRIRNVDVAKESAEMTRNQILQQASVSILSQANQMPALALSLLQ